MHLTAFATQLGLSYGRSRLDHADAAVDTAMQDYGVLHSVLGKETAEVCACVCVGISGAGGTTAPKYRAYSPCFCGCLFIEKRG